MHKNGQLEEERVAPMEGCSLLKILKNKKPSHLLSNIAIGIWHVQLRVTIFSTGSKF